MNIEALTHDLNAVLHRHGITGSVQTTLSGLLTLAATPGGQMLIGRAHTGATLFAVDDTGHTAFSRSRTHLPVNGALLNQLLGSITPMQLRELLQSVLDEIAAARPRCNCPKCVARRGESSSAHSPKDKGALEAAFIRADATDCRSKH